MRELLETLFSSEGFMPHGACYLWDPVVLRLHLISDVLTGIAYYAIPPTLAYLVVRARRVGPEGGRPAAGRLPYDWMFLAFGLFIVACGTTHFLEAWTIWTPAYRLSGTVKALTAVASVGTALALPPLVPKALDLLREARTSLARKVELEVAHRDLESAHHRLTELDELKTRFFAHVSHELRTPLTLILGPVKELLVGSQLTPEEHRRLEVVRHNAEILARLVDDLLDVARLGAGRVTLGDAPEGGALFTVELPYEAPGSTVEAPPEVLSAPTEPPTPATSETTGPEIGEGAAPEAVSDEAEDGRPRLLIVEEDPDLRRHLVEVLSTDYRTWTAGDGVRGLALARELEPDVVISDVMMSNMTGDELVRRLRASSEGEDVPVLLLTARADEELRVRMLRGGADDYLVKPAPTEELRARLARLVSIKRTRDLLRRALDSREQDVETLATELARRKGDLERSLEENQLLLQEVQHRVKGNLQTVSSLLRLQARMVGDPAARATLEESRDRIDVMARLHSELYASPGSMGVHFSRYVRMLVRHLRDSHREASPISFELPSTEITLGPGEAIPCGMIVYELVANALRHAFPKGRPGTVRIELRPREDDELELSVEDDGVGIDPDLVAHKLETFGLQMVRTFANQLQGRLRVEREHGSRFTVTFPSSAHAGSNP